MHEAIATRDAATRARRGAFYTPEAWVAEALDPVLDALPPDGRVLDPACGAGAFLLHALERFLADGIPAAEAIDRLVGADRDPWAARLCRLALAIRADVPLDRPHIHHGDALLGPTGASAGSTHAPDGVPTIDWTRAGAFDAIVGNPPFLGGKRQATVMGPEAAQAIRERRGLDGNADLAAHFLHLGAELLAPGGQLCFWTTDTIAQGETRRQGLGRLTPDPLRLVRAVRTRRWPGDAAVYVALIHAVRGSWHGALSLDGREVHQISSRLRTDGLEQVPPPREAPRPPAFIGCDLKSPHFLFGDPAGHSLGTLAALRHQDPQLHEVVRPYVTGSTLTRSLDGNPTRWVADLTGLELDQARSQHPALLRLLERTVPPDRVHRSRPVARAPWWRFFRTRPALRRALVGKQRCLTAGLITQHLLWTWQPTDRVFNHKVVIVATEDDALFGALQCRLHDHWARALSSTFGGGLNYSPSRCYLNYPLPPRSERVARAARALCAQRRESIAALGVGLGPLQTRLQRSDPHPAIEALRRASRELDAAMLEAWGWQDLDLDDVDRTIERLLNAPVSTGEDYSAGT